MSNFGKYEFVRIKDKQTGKEGTVWYFRAKSYKDVNIHTEKIFKPIMQAGYNSASKKSIDSVFKHGDVVCMPHPNPTDHAEIAIQSITEIKGYKKLPLPMFNVANELLTEAINGRIKDIDKYGECYLANGVQCFGFSKSSHEICDSIFSDEFVYPTQRPATMNDVRIIVWNGGKHFYAKVGNFDIVDSKGNQKWNTESEAKAAAEEYIKREKIYI